MRKPTINRYSILSLLAPVFGFVTAMIILLIIVIAIGKNPGEAVAAILRMTTSSASRFGTVVSQAIPLYIAGIAVAFAFKGGVFNIGVEGQYFVGGLVGAIAGIYLKLPSIIHIPVVVLFAMAGGALWAAIPAYLKVKRGVHEVITTIMFNNIAIYLVNYLVNVPLSGFTGGESLEPQTKAIQSTALFGKLNGFFQALGWKIGNHVYLDYSLIVAIVMGFIVWFVLFKTRYGFDVRAVGTALDASHFAGIRIGRVQIGTFLMSGALAGLIGLQEIFAIRGYYTYEIAAGVGFDGIAIALIGRNNPIGVVFAALLFSFLKQAGYGLQLYVGIANSVSYVITGLMILIIVIANEVMTRYIRRLRRQEAG